MAIRKIIKDSEPEIRTISEEVKEIDDPILQISQDMKDTLATTEGVGISAIQIGEAKRIIYVHYEGKEYTLINPMIVNQIGKVVDSEGCLSVKQDGYEYICGDVERSFIIEVEGLNIEGEKIHVVADGMLARIFEHEIDHLNGILYTDKIIGNLRKFKTKEEKEAWKEEKKQFHKGKVLLGMSGGVDSSVAAVLLKEAGYEVIGATMKLWEDEENEEIEGGCCSFSATNDAKRVCDQLDIPHYTLNCKEDFKKYVVEDFIKCYQCAKTPNPCIECNQYLKFGTFYQKALELGCEYIATGHYAKIEYDENYQSYVMKKSQAEAKDQTYFLYRVPKEVLPKILFPLEELSDKELVRKIAEAHDLQVAHKKDSQEVCFVPDNNYVEFLEKQSKEKSKIGNIILKNGTILGKHKGLIHYTIGQRKGIGISYPVPLYVIGLNAGKNEVIVGEEKELYQKVLYAKELNFLIDIDLTKKLIVMAKVRYRAKEAKATIEFIEKDCVKVTFEEPQRAITPGQSVVFYIGNIVLGGGKIEQFRDVP